MKTLLVGTLLAVALTSQTASADTKNINVTIKATPKHVVKVRAVKPGLRSRGINKRERTQARRIKQGVKSGELTAKETTRLAKQQVSIHRQERRMKSDGVFTARERARVHKRQNRASKVIYRAKHN